MKRYIPSAMLSLVLGAAACAATAQPALEVKESSYELTLENVTLPSSTAGTIIFKECPECEVRSLVVNAGTRYFVDGVELPFDKFTQAAESLRAGLGQDYTVGVYVHYAVGTTTVNRVRLAKFEFSR